MVLGENRFSCVFVSSLMKFVDTPLICSGFSDLIPFPESFAICCGRMAFNSDELITESCVGLSFLIAFGVICLICFVENVSRTAGFSCAS